MKTTILVTVGLCLLRCSPYTVTVFSCKETDGPVVQIINGRIRGATHLSRDNRLFHSFKGIPYAKAPIGDLRFRAPEKPNSWTDTRDCLEDSQICIQKNYFFSNPTIIGSEDCLYLNVYTPNLLTHNVGTEKLPVMVFMHWGGFIAGSSHSSYLGPEYFMDKDIVLVTFNYRLGAFGFLSTNDDASPGNYALKDQVAALEWVRDNIENFGGDKNLVTIFGSSAGAASVHYHLISPASTGLFHRAISQSGSVLAPWAKPLGVERDLAQMQGEFVGCSNVTEAEDLVDCIRKVDAEVIVNSGDNFKFFSVDPLCVFLPSIETKTAKNAKPFITKQPVEYLRSGEYNLVPFIMGVNKDEGIMRAAGLLRQQSTRKLLNENFNILMPKLMALPSATREENVESTWNTIKGFYLQGQEHVNVTDPRSIQGLINLYSDRAFIYGSYQSALMHSMTGHDQLWFYNFNYRGQYSYGEHFAASDNDDVEFDWGVSHCDELLYLFKSTSLFDDLEKPNDITMSRIMIKIWTNFAKHGDPTPQEYWNKDGKWLTVGADLMKKNKNIRFLDITGSCAVNDSIRLTMEEELYLERMKFWETLPLTDNIEDLMQRHIELV